MDLKKILKSKDSLNLDQNHRRLILLAMIKANFRIKEAFEINCEGSFYTFEAYDKMWRRLFPNFIGIKHFKEEAIQQLSLSVNKVGVISFPRKPRKPLENNDSVK